MKQRVGKTAATLLIIAAIVALAVTFASRRHSEPVTVIKGSALGTVYQVSVKGDAPTDLRERLDSLFAAANRSMSIFDTTSLLCRINRSETDTADTNIIKCIETARRVSELSGGLYDITVQPLVEALGFGAADRQADPNIDSLLQFVGYRLLSVEGNRIVKSDRRVQIGLNSIAKGAVVDMAAEMLETMGSKDYLVDIGGEIFCRGTNGKGKEWVVGIETPFEGNYSLTGEYITTTIHLSGLGLATSGDYRNFYLTESGEKVTHIINPLTGQNTVSSLLSATVIADNCALADAYGTMFVALGEQRAIEIAQREHIAALFILAGKGDQMRIEISEAMRQHIDKSKK